MKEPQIIMPEGGIHNADLDKSRDRLLRGSSYRDLSTVCLIPTRGQIAARVIQAWFGLLTAMNQKFMRMFLTGMEVGDAYTQGVAFVTSHPELSQWRYVLTLEEDNIPPPDGLLRLYEAIEGRVDGQKYDAVGGLYWTKGEGGMPMIYGDPGVMPLSFVPQMPQLDTVQRCNGLGMGFTLFRLSMLRDERLGQPLFKTEQSYTPGVGARAYTQDLHFFERAGGWGYKFACDTRVRVGHYSIDQDMVW
jgi:hypothetical protein